MRQRSRPWNEPDARDQGARGQYALLPIDGLRAFLAWTVVAAHITWYTGAAERVHALGVINRFADNAVTIFIIISGLVITNLTLTRKELYLPYITRRALRLYPAYLVCLSYRLFS